MKAIKRLILPVVFICTISFLLINFSCNKSRYSAITRVIKKQCIVNGTDFLDVYLITKQYPYTDSVFVSVQNGGYKKINSATLLIEINSSSSPNYDNATNLYTIHIDTLGLNSMSPNQYLYSNESPVLDDNINVGLIKLDSDDHPFANKYRNNFTTFNTANNSFPVVARGYVFIDGVSTFRFKFLNGDTSYYNIYGSFIQNNSYTGQILNGDNDVISSLSLDASKTTGLDNDILKFTLNFNSPINDTITSISFNLLKY